MNRRFYLLKLVEQLEDEKVDSLIDVVKGMVHPMEEQSFSFNNHTKLTKIVTDYEYAEQSITENINDIFK